jgi:hypothetical protein
VTGSLEGIVSKRKDSAYRSGRSPCVGVLHFEPIGAVKREEEEEWGKKKPMVGAFRTSACCGPPHECRVRCEDAPVGTRTT